LKVAFPDGTQVRAASLIARQDAEPDFGLYLDSRWEPTWPASIVDWEDFGLPSDPDAAAGQIEDAFARAKSGSRVEIGCAGGLGRTGTALACMAVLAGVPPEGAVAWVRTNYNARAVETVEQQEWVLWFARRRDGRAKPGV
jgi:protein-tyrosine phosphatase